MEKINATGRRKAAVARVYLQEGNGKIIINGKDLKEYFPQLHIQNKVNEPLAVLEASAAYDLEVNVHGGGIKGQAEAIRMAVSRAMVQVNIDNKPALKSNKLLTRDAREVERKKYGKPKARKSFQFSKR
jgi:small subunit ribosomal protein S9